MAGLRPERREPGHERRHALGEGGIGRHHRQLILPQLDIAAGERGEIGRFPHGGDYRAFFPLLRKTPRATAWPAALLRVPVASQDEAGLTLAIGARPAGR